MKSKFKVFDACPLAAAIVLAWLASLVLVRADTPPNYAFTIDGSSIPGPVWNPSGSATDSSNNVYVADGGNARLQQFSTNGTLLIQWGAAGTNAGQFTGLAAVDPNAHYIYAADALRIQVFTYLPGISPTITDVSIPAPGQFQFHFTGNPDTSYSVIRSTDLSAPLSNWTVLGVATQSTGSTFRFTDPAATNPHSYYLLRTP